MARFELMDTTEQRIIETAKAFVNEQSWPWIEPVDVQLARAQVGDRMWSVKTNINARGRNVRLLIRESDLSVIESAYLPR